jgi:hypothetical protein
MTQLASAAPDPNPSDIAVPAGNQVFLVGHATGVQKYSCNAGSWGPASTPEATLVDDNGKIVATHFGGPTWQATDGSTIQGDVVPPRVTVDPTAIPWLLLKAKNGTAGPGGGSQLVKTTYIQRLNTTGGLAPTGPCDPNDPTQVKIPYTADYKFWKSVGA